MENLQKFTQISRWLGAVAIIISSIQFMIAGKLDLNSIDTHYLFLALTTGLAILGIFTAKKLSDPKTARIFLSLALALVPAQLAQVGGFIIAKLNGIANNIPAPFITQLPSEANIFLVFLSSALLLIPVIYIGFKVLFRENTKNSSMLYIALSLCILLPTRNIYAMVSLVLIQVFTVIVCNKNTKKINTQEVKLAKLIQFWPIIIIAGRTLLYPASDIFYASVWFIISMTSFIGAKSILKNGKVITMAQGFSALIVFLSSVFLVDSLNLSDFMGSLFFLFLIFGMSFKANLFSIHLRGSSAIALIFTLIFAYESSSAFYQVLAIQACVPLIYSATLKREAFSFVLTVGSSVIYLASIITSSIKLPEIGLWQSFAATGICILLFTSIIDKYLLKYKYPIINFYRSFKIQE